jgi:serine/threonine protein kinase
LKPENILVNDDCTIQICDFGLSRSLKDLPTEPEEQVKEQDEEEEKTPSSAQNKHKKYGKDDRPCLNIWSGQKKQTEEI